MSEALRVLGKEKRVYGTLQATKQTQNFNWSTSGHLLHIKSYEEYYLVGYNAV
jgi:hypothetical protein